ncbi:hypothetical protein ACEPAG_511 [Sanghuangporus baumii]
MASADDNCYSITVRPEDLLLACVAYSRPEMLALDKIISLHSQNALVLDAEVEQSKSIADLPVELLLRIRAELQSSLFASLKAEVAAALEQYQAALVEGICQDCFWWNSDVYGSDVWTWVENGYRGACSCAIVGDIDPRSPSETKRHVLRKFQGIDIGTRGSWLRAYIQRTYLDEKTSAWNFARGILAQFGCKHRFERPQSQYPSTAPATTSPMPTVPENNTTTTAMSGQPEVKKTPRRITSCDFGALVRILQRPERSESEESEITLRRLLRELDLKAPADDEPSIALQSSATRFVDKIHRRTACSRHFLAQRGPACNCMDCLALFAAPTASLKSYAFVSSRSLPSSRLSCILPSVPSRRTLTSVAFCAASVAYLVARVVF